MELDRNSIMTTFLDTLNEIASPNYQLRVWIKGLGPECSSFDEVEDYFFMEGVDIIDNYSDYSITSQQHQALVKLRDLFKIFRESHSSELQEIIDLPEWKEVICAAKKALQAFNYKKSTC